MFLVSSYIIFSVVSVSVTGATYCSGSVCLPDGYNKLDSPSWKKPMQINISARILDVYSINNKKQILHLKMQMILEWVDDRINMEEKSDVASLDFLNYIWKPDLEIRKLVEMTNIKVIEIEEQLSLSL